MIYVHLFVLQYVLEELNVRLLAPCNDTLKYASLCAEPDFRYVNVTSSKTLWITVLCFQLDSFDCFLVVC